MDTKIAVIGVGNPLRRDDGIGIVLLDHLKEHAYNDMISYIDGGTGGMNLLYLFDRFQVVIVVDAVNFGGDAGEVRFFSVDDVISHKHPVGLSTHQNDVLEIIRISRKLDQCPDQIFVFAVQPADVSIGEGLSSVVESNLDDIIERLEDDIQQVFDSVV